MTQRKIRHAARSLALQKLYSWEINNDISNEAEEFILGEEDEETNIEEVRIYTAYLVEGTKEHIEDIDTMINKHSKNHSVKTIGKVNKNILRLSIFSLLYNKEVHPNIVIDEAVKLSLEFSDDVSYSFINGVLDSIKKKEL